MNEFFNQLQKEARTTKLSSSEKQAMRVHLYNVMKASPAYTPAQAEAVAEVVARRSVQSMYVWLSPRYMVPAAILLVVGLSGGTAFAAQSALPGEPLYAVKVQVNEKVAVALATTPAAKAAVNAAIATTRLEEAETLASQGTLDATTTAALANNFATHADAAQINTVAIAANDPGTAAQLGTSFSSTLAAHGAILAQLASNAGTSTVQTNSDALAVQAFALATHGRNNDEGRGAGGAVTTTLAINSTGEGVAVSAVRTEGGVNPTVGDYDADGIHADTAEPVDADASVQVTTFSALAPQATSLRVEASSTIKASATLAPVAAPLGDAPTNKNAKTKNMPSANQARTSISNEDSVIAPALASQASTTLAHAQASFAAIAPSLDASTSEQITLQLTDLGEMLMQGNDQLAAGDNTGAKLSFSHVVRASVRLDAFLKAGKKFNASFLMSLLK